VSGIKSSFAEEWRTGGKIKLNVYEGNRPVCQCHNEEDARRIVDAMNRVLGNSPKQRKKP